MYDRVDFQSQGPTRDFTRSLKQGEGWEQMKELGRALAPVSLKDTPEDQSTDMYLPPQMCPGGDIVSLI